MGVTADSSLCVHTVNVKRRDVNVKRHGTVVSTRVGTQERLFRIVRTRCNVRRIALSRIGVIYRRVVNSPSKCCAACITMRIPHSRVRGRVGSNSR